MAQVRIPAGRMVRWAENFEGRHGPTTYGSDDGTLTGRGEDGVRFAARLPFDQDYAGPPDAASLAAAVAAPEDWGVLLVRKGGFAVARLERERLVESKVGQRHVQGRTKAGGQSQQRFARRRDNQARQAYQAAAEHAVRILGSHTRLPVVAGGDRPAVEEVLGDPRLVGLRITDPWLAVPDPRRSVLEEAIREAVAVAIRIEDPGAATA